MKVSIENENNFIVFLNNNKFNLQDNDELETRFKNIFNQIKLRYDIDVNGYYNIVVYKDDIYGMILSIEKEDLDYLDYFDNQVEMRIVISPYDKFVYKLNNNDLNVPINNSDLYNYLGNLYIVPSSNINNVEFAMIMEYTTIIYGEEASKILKYSKKII